MTLQVFKDYESLSEFAAEKILEQVQAKPASVLCLATGNTPVGTYQKLVQLVEERHADFSRVSLVALDEWLGIPPEVPGSCHQFLHQYLIEPLHLETSQVFLFDGMSTKPEEECARMDDTIKTLGGIDFMIAGIGKNGHVGFNEPGVSPDLGAHVMDLEEFTRKEGQKYFPSAQPIEKGITLGLQHVMQARTAIIMANGEAKSDIIFHALNDEVSPAVPASYIRLHSNGYVIIDSAAAQKLLAD